MKNKYQCTLKESSLFESIKHEDKDEDTINLFTHPCNNDENLNDNYLNELFAFQDKFKIDGYLCIFHLQIGNGITNLTPSQDSSKKTKDLKKISEFENTLFIPKTPQVSFSNKTTSRIFSNIFNLKQSNYYYINFNPNVYLAEYASYYLNSKYGVIQMKSLSSGKTIPYLSQENVQLLLLPTVSIDEQKKVVENMRMINMIKQNLRALPEKLNYRFEEFDSEVLFDNINELKIKKLIKKDESKTHEYKSYLRHCLKTKKAEKYITDACLKTIVAFLNTDGGELIIGVRDNKTVCGLNEDNFSNNDECERFLNDKISSLIGVKFLTYININFIELDGKTICHVTCDKLPEDNRCFLGDEIFIRRGPASIKLTSKQTADWLDGRKV